MSKDLIAKIYARLSKSLERYPTRTDLLKEKIPRSAVRHHFGNLDELKEFSRDLYPLYFKNIVDPEYFSDDSYRALKEEVKKYRRFVITTAVAGAPVHEDFYSSIKVFCKKRNALLLVLPANYALYDLPVDLVHNEKIIFKDIKLNDNLLISSIKIDPKQIDPSTSLDDIGGHSGTIIIGSPKQRRRPIANSSSTYSHIIQATGSITRPRYMPRSGIPLRRDILAAKQHVMGCIVVEVVNSKYFHFRNIEMCQDGSFNDMFVNYSPDGTEACSVEAIIQGDYHSGDTCPQADAVADDLCLRGKPKYRIFHDLFDGKSINHHERYNQVLRSRYADAGKLDLKQEMITLAKNLKSKLRLNTAEKLLVVPSNHDDFLLRYLKEGKFEDNNRLISTKLQVMAIEGRNPLEAGLESLGLESENRIKWIDLDTDFKLTRQKIEVGAHGHLGANGRSSPGSIGMYKAYGKCTYGHCHYGEINHGAMSVGTSTPLKVDYNKGPSSWSQTHQIMYSDGTRQLINVIDGKYELKS